MKRIISYLLLLCVVVFSSCTKQEKKVMPDFTNKTMDLSVKPQDNFYKFVNGNWMKNNPLPDDKSRYGSFDKLREDSKTKQKAILAELEKTTNKEGSNEQLIGDFYKSGMDLAKINKLGYSPISGYLTEIDAMTSKKDLVDAVVKMHNYSFSSVFYLFTGADSKNSSQNIAQIWQGGLGLADRAYYLDEDDKSKDIIIKYEQHIAKMFTLISVDKEEAAKDAKIILNFETELAKVSMNKLDRRDPTKTYNITTIEDLATLSPEFDWSRYLAERKIDVKTLNICQPGFIKGLSDIIKTETLDNWKIYLKWKVLNASASLLSEDLVAADFDFYGRFLKGTPKNEDRWKRVLGQVNANVGELLGQIYVKKYFPPKAKLKMLTLVGNLKTAFKHRINSLKWMSDVTKTKALEKLNSFTVKIGYPDKWRKYEGLKINKNNYLGNILESRRLNVLFEKNKINKPVDKTEWGMTPQTVNAYYNPLNNEIVFPAAILQPPFFYLDADIAVNYGAIGVVIGHEMSHGFDDKGCMYDKDGNLNMWWTKEDKEKFDAKTQVLVDQFDKIIVIDDVHANGRYCLGENIADCGGLHISYDAFKTALKDTVKIDGFTPEQRFFIGYSRVWGQNIRDKEIIRLTKEDVHSLGKYRVNSQVNNVDAFYKAFDIKKGDKMFVAKDKRAQIW